MVWSAEELRDFLATIEHSDWYVPIFLAVNTGMRRGEVLGLPWRNVDLDTAPLVVDQQILSVKYKASVADVKTSNSRRTIDLDPRTVAVLKAWRRDQLEQHMGTGVRNGGDFVFTRADGGPIHPDFFSQSRGKLMRDSEARRIRLHDLRHTQPRLHDDRVPTRHARHEGRRSTCFQRSGFRIARHAGTRPQQPTGSSSVDHQRGDLAYGGGRVRCSPTN